MALPMYKYFRSDIEKLLMSNQVESALAQQLNKVISPKSLTWLLRCRLAHLNLNLFQ